MDRDLIDRNELIKKLDPEYKETVKLIKSGETHLDSLAEGYTEVHDLITRAPTIDAKPVKRGYWNYKFTIDGQSYRYCSECLEIIYDDAVSKNYCPYCGAEMSKKV